MSQVDSLEELLHEELKDTYDAEKQLTKALPKMVKKASSGELKEAFDEHLRQTEQHLDRLEQVFDQLGVPARGKKCEGMKHLIAEGEEMISDVKDQATRDALMIAAAQKVEHYEIAAYGTMRTWATLLGKHDVAALLEDTLEEEKETDQRLTRIAESFVNEAAAAQEGMRSNRGGRARPPSRPSRAAMPRMGRQTAADRARKARKR